MVSLEPESASSSVQARSLGPTGRGYTYILELKGLLASPRLAFHLPQSPVTPISGALRSASLELT